MVSFGSRRGAAGAGAMPLMILAFVSVAGLMAWLAVKARPVEVEVVEGEAVVEENMAMAVAADEFGANPMAHAGMLIEVRGLGVNSHVGAEALFLLVPGQANPYIVKMLPEVAANAEEIENSAIVAVTGRVYAMSDSVADAWVASGGIGEGDRILAIFAESFLEIEEITVLAPPPPEEN